MLEAVPSRTAYRVALRRAAHQVFDDPLVFPDKFALRILGLTPKDLRSGALRAPARPYSRSLRAFLVARSAFAEETLAEAITRGVSQYVLLGAGLDTFAWRNPWPNLRVFEVDHPATQQWKRELAVQHGMPEAATRSYVPVDFEQDDLARELRLAGFREDLPTLFAWLGVVPYLTAQAFHATLRFIANHVPGSGVVLDYGVPRALLSPEEQLQHDSLAARVAAAGEPFQLFFTPEQMRSTLVEAGLDPMQDMNRDAINARWFRDRLDSFEVLGSGGHFVAAFRKESSRSLVVISTGAQ